MKKHCFLKILAVLVGMVVIFACSSAPTDEAFKDYDPANFSNSTSIDNRWLPLLPGTQWVFEGYTIEDGEQVPHRVVITVTDLIKVIDGVRSVVTWDLDYSADQMVEAELAFFAQDNDGTVWRMGEYPEEYEDGKFVDAPTWIHGIDDALAGIAMYANPTLDTPEYPQGWGPDVDWNDRGKVDQVDQQLCVEFGCYQDVLVIAESSKSEPAAYQLKYYAPGVGNISVDWTGKDQTQEKMELVNLLVLSASEMEDARANALALEAHAYDVSQDVYGNTLPMEKP